MLVGGKGVRGGGLLQDEQEGGENVLPHRPRQSELNGKKIKKYYSDSVTLNFKFG